MKTLSKGFAGFSLGSIVASAVMHTSADLAIVTALLSITYAILSIKEEP